MTLSWTDLGICPKCQTNDGLDSPLVLRTNKQDGKQFLSCNEWPACTYRINFWTPAQVAKQEAYEATQLIKKE